MICKQCATEFTAQHFNQAMCSDECRKIARRIAKGKYKSTAKGANTESRWRKSPKKKSTDKRYYTSAKGRAAAVKRMSRLIKSNVYYLDRKRLSQRAEYRTLRELLISAHARCQKCGSVNDLTIDHIKPVSLGGEHVLENLQVLCRSCNSSKGQRVG